MMLSSPAVMAHPSSIWLTLPGRMTTERTGEIAQRWMEMVLGEKFSQGFPKVLLSGEWLCALANKVYQALGMRDRSCASIKTSWPSAMSADSLSATSLTAVAGSTEETNAINEERRSSERLRLRDSSIGDMWLKQKRVARENVDEYLRACEVIGVLPQDIFEPDDLLELQNLDKVYRNILALQSVAVSISHRRSIDDRSSASISMRVGVSSSPAPSLLTSHDSILSPRRSTDVIRDENMPWEQLLEQYEAQQLKSSAIESTSGGKPTHTEGVGKLAHDLWRTEEHIRARLLRENGPLEPVPDTLHGKLWLLTSGASTEMQRCTGQYQQYAEMAVEDTDATRQIDADLHRTVPDEDKPTWNDDKTKMMRRVLVAYSCFNPTLGYCQGLNYIVARLLQFVEEEQAFYLLTKMIRIVPDDFYTTMLGLAVDQHVFADLVRVQEPEIARHLEELGGSGMELSLACTEWFLTLFSSPCPKDVTVRIWDLMFLMGDEILFRFALALMRLEKQKLLKCNAYGDLLKHLNELGRNKTNVAQLAMEAQKKETVSRLRIDDFRAHHRLQLATGIAVHSAEDSTGDSSGDAKEDAKAKLFGTKKRPGLFKPVEKSAGRLHRTFDRNLADDYADSLQKEHPTFSCYYDGRPPLVFDQYWGSRASKIQWGNRNYRRIAEFDLTKEKQPKEERRRLQSDGSGLRIPDDNGDGPRSGGRAGRGRERRSRSIALIQPNKKDDRRPVEDETQLSRSPKGWLQRIEGWHKDLKIQKEKKKIEKMKIKLGHLDTTEISSSVPTRGLAQRERERGHNHTFAAAPAWRHIEENELCRGASFDGHQIGKGRVEKRTESMDVNVSRSYSDPYLSPNDPYAARGSWQDPVAHMEMEDDDGGGQSKSELTQSKRSVERQRSDLNESKRRESLEQKPSSRLDELAVNDASTTARRRRPPSSAEPKPHERRPMSANAVFDSDAFDSTRLSFDMGKPPTTAVSELSASMAKTKLASSLSSCHRAETVDVDDLFESLSQPAIRRNQSLPVGQQDGGANLHLQHQQQHNQQQFYSRHMKKVTSETARVIRERAQVLSYMQRKASDASSLAGSFPLTPNEPSDVLRMSESSSDSSRYSEFILPTTRSAKSAVQPLVNVRKSSFSFFDKLSSDTENHLDDLGSFMDGSNGGSARESFDSSIFSRTWSPSSAHHKILAAMSSTDDQ